MINYNLVLYSLLLEVLAYGILPDKYKIMGTICILIGLYAILIKKWLEYININ